MAGQPTAGSSPRVASAAAQELCRLRGGERWWRRPGGPGARLSLGSRTDGDGVGLYCVASHREVRVISQLFLVLREFFF